MNKIYAIFETGGKQYKVRSGQVIDVDRLDIGEGIPVELDRVLLIDNDGQVTVGTPTIEGAKVMATSQGEYRGKKTVVLKYKPKTRFRKKTGHRQDYTRLVIDNIIESGAGDAPDKAAGRSESEVTEDGA